MIPARLVAAKCFTPCHGSPRILYLDHVPVYWTDLNNQLT